MDDDDDDDDIMECRFFHLVSLAEVEVSACEKRNPHRDPTSYQTQEAFE
jgi:hypothetical protein